MSIIDLLSGKQNELAPPMESFPIGTSAHYKTEHPSFYGSGIESLLMGRQAHMYPIEWGITRNTPLSKTINATNKSPIPDELLREYREAAEAQNRSALVSLGLNAINPYPDPETGEVSTAKGWEVLGLLPPGRVFPTEAGTYATLKTNPSWERGFAQDSSSLVHEATHRGMKRLRSDYDGDTQIKVPPWFAGADEESTVRQIMRTKMGDPEHDRIPQSIEMQRKREFESPESDDFFRSRAHRIKQNNRNLDELESAAARALARRFPSGRFGLNR